jgi:hypothetical protein
MFNPFEKNRPNPYNSQGLFGQMAMSPYVSAQLGGEQNLMPASTVALPTPPSYEESQGIPSGLLSADQPKVGPIEDYSLGQGDSGIGLQLPTQTDIGMQGPVNGGSIGLQLPNMQIPNMQIPDQDEDGLGMFIRDFSF